MTEHDVEEYGTLCNEIFWLTSARVYASCPKGYHARDWMTIEEIQDIYERMCELTKDK